MNVNTDLTAKIQNKSLSKSPDLLEVDSPVTNDAMKAKVHNISERQ